MSDKSLNLDGATLLYEDLRTRLEEQAVHNHDSRYYREDEIDSFISSLNSAINQKVPISRKINNKALTSNITLTASDVGASASGHTHSEYAPKPTYYQGTGTLSAMSVGEIRLVTISGGSSASFKLPSGGQYMVGGVEAYQDYTIENSVGLPFSGKYSGGASISVDGYGRWCIVLRIS